MPDSASANECFSTKMEGTLSGSLAYTFYAGSGAVQ